ncbi:Unannotated [Lentimonas sp. CC19]|nr:Unannotated [Lentimonas sp. CC19]CAA6693367.1 Unannotated [Lentimonas sp. CC10]CAA7071842.1 Unannotated [Lentimonas sp. CC11]
MVASVFFTGSADSNPRVRVQHYNGVLSRQMKKLYNFEELDFRTLWSVGVSPYEPNLSVSPPQPEAYAP